MPVTNIVGVVVNRMVRNVDQVYHYTASDELYQKITVGSLVSVPFGKGDSEMEAYVVELPKSTEFSSLKEVRALLSGEPLFDEEMLAVCRFMQERYFCTLAAAIKAITPPGSGVRRRQSSDKIITGSVLAIPGDEALLLLEKIRQKAPRQAKILELLLQNDFVANSDIRIITGAGQGAISALEKKGLIRPQQIEVYRNPVDFSKIPRTKALVPTPEQKAAIRQITHAAQKGEHQTFLLHGVTGSGKTEVFLQCIEAVIQNGRSAIVLVPEISLTPQMVERFAGRFGSRIAVLHSRLSFGERYDEYKRIRAGEVRVVIGARSAIFAPLHNLGLIIMDEEHEASYQAENVPAYHAREIALLRAKQNHIPLILASATPSVESYWRAKKGEYALLTLSARANRMQMPDVEIVDMRKELAQGNRSVLSERLKEEIRRNLERGEQTILFLNRRGFSTFVSCRNCGYVVKCEQCNIAMTYHKARNYLTCHYCGYTVKNLTQCPACGSRYIRHFGTGTQRVEEEVRELFPGASVLRMDVDTTGGKSSHQQILEQFAKEKTDILIGTQMVAKGLDFPEVTLVGVLAADLSLNLDDFRAGERTFDLITQVCGRAGRGKRAGRAVVQTYMPENEVLLQAKEQDYEAFFENEIALRKSLYYPPFCDILSLLLTGPNEAALSAFAAKTANHLRMECLKQKSIQAEVLGPGPATLSKINNKYRWRILIKCRADSAVREIVRRTLARHDKQKESKWINITAELNPNSMM